MVYITENEYGEYIQEERFNEKNRAHNKEILNSFLKTKQLEGLSQKTISNYTRYLLMLSRETGKTFESLSATDIKTYMSNYQIMHSIKNDSMDNMRRVFSSFYNFLEEEDYIIKSPIKKIHKIKGEKTIKIPFTEEDIVHLQDSCRNIRERAIVDFLYSTGVRVSELVELNRDDINFDDQEAIVIGKGSKERIIYFDARTKVHLQNYLNTREDANSALFVSQMEPYGRLTKAGIEYLISQLGIRAGIEKCHPHRFRRTLATRLIDRGVPIEQVQCILGHTKIDTTLIYAQVNQCNVKMSHTKFA